MLSKDDFITLVSNWNFKDINQKYSIVDSLESGNYTDSITINKLIQKYTGEDVLESILAFENESVQSGGAQEPATQATSAPTPAPVTEDPFKNLSAQDKVRLKEKAKKDFERSNLFKTNKELLDKINRMTNDLVIKYNEVADLENSSETKNEQKIKKAMEDVKEREKELLEKEFIAKEIEDLAKKNVERLQKTIETIDGQINIAKNKIPSVAAENKAKEKAAKAEAAKKAKDTLKKRVKNVETINQLTRKSPTSSEQNQRAPVQEQRALEQRRDQNNPTSPSNNRRSNSSQSNNRRKKNKKKKRGQEKYYSDSETDVIESVLRRLGN